GFSILPGTVTNQMYYQRIFAARNVREGRQSIYIAAAGIILAGFYALAIGLAVRAMNGSLRLNGHEQAAGWFLVEIPSWLLALYGSFLMATIVSTTVPLCSRLLRTWSTTCGMLLLAKSAWQIPTQFRYPAGWDGGDHRDGPANQ